MTPPPARIRRAGWPSRLFWTAFTLREIAAGRDLPYRSPRQLAALQAQRVREIVAHARATVPFYRDAMQQRGLAPGDFATAADLARLPLVTGADLAADPLRFRSTAVADEPLLETTTSGTTGHAKRIWWDRAAVFRARAAGMHQRRVLAEILGGTHGYRALSVARRGSTSDEVRAFHHAHSWLPDPLDPHRDTLSPEDDFATNLELVNRLRPDVMSGFGSYVGALYRWARASGRAIHAPKLLWHGGEQLPAADADLLAHEYGIVVRTAYQACEAFRIAISCPRGGGLHLFTDQVDVRIADAQGRTLQPGQRGHVVLSNLTNRATVLLNYAIGDVGVMADAPCPCGRTLPMLASLDGRADDLVRLPGGGVAHDSVLLSRLYAVPGVLRLQLVQDTLERFTIRAVRATTCEAADADRFRERLAHALAEALGGRRVEVAVEITDRLQPDASGKFRTVVSRVRDDGASARGTGR